MADLRTTAEERRRVTDAAFAREDMDHRACLALLDDVDLLLAENAKLRAVAEAAKAMQTAHFADDRCEAVPAGRRMLVALAALEAP